MSKIDKELENILRSIEDKDDFVETCFCRLETDEEKAFLKSYIEKYNASKGHILLTCMDIVDLRQKEN